MRTHRLRFALALGSIVAFSTVLVSAQAGAATSAERYIVQLADPPLASYRGGIAGLAPTNPATLGAVRLDPKSAASKAYLDYLAGKQSSVRTALQTALGRAVSFPYSYRYAYNGFAAVLTDTEASTLRGLAGVADVQKEYVREVQTDVGPAWIGAPGVWSGATTGGLAGTKGERVVVGVIDTGINHDHPSFADVGGDGYNHANPRGTFYGLCDPLLGKPFCNDKLIGVYDYTGTTPEDDNQHGSHTASTTAGNVVSAVLNAPTLTLTREISGVAPHANLITYKACGPRGCLGASLTAAIDQATADMVDVINYSIGGGPSDPWNDSDSEGFLGARDAGIFVSASAGNDGPGAETVGSPANAPWLLSVGASTHNRSLKNSLTSMSGGKTAPPATLYGKSFTTGYGPAAIVHAADFGDRLCSAPFLPGTFKGQIVICERGINPRLEKGRNVKVGGAGGMVLANSAADGEGLVGDPHELPAVHIGYRDAQVLETWVRDGGTGHKATIAGTTVDTAAVNGDVMAGFSSRGPNKPAPGVLKPDITGPGVDVLAAVKTPEEFGILSGTSMSSPHLAGSATLVRSLHPDWTPAEVQSAMMTTALDSGVRKEDGVRPADSFDMGAGRIDLTKAGRAGFVLDEQGPDFVAADPKTGGDPTALNLASLTSADCVGICTWKRTLRGTTSGTWTVKTSGPRALRLTVSPSRFTLAPGTTQELTVTADVSKLPAGKYAFGRLTLDAGGAAPEAHLPITVLPGGTATPVKIETTSTTGTRVVSVTSPIEIRDLTTRISGLTQGIVQTRTVVQDPTPLDAYDTDVGTFTVLIDVPAGSRFIAAEIARSTATDIDLFVGRDDDGDGASELAEELCRSASDTALESCRLGNPEGGKYWIRVQNWLTGGRVIDEVDLVAAVVPGTSAGNLTATGPKTVPANTPFDVTLAWNEPGLDAGETWFGLVELGADRKNPANAGSLFVTLKRTS